MGRMTEKQLFARDAKRNLAAELLQAVRDMKAGRGKVVFTISSTRKTPQRWGARPASPIKGIVE